MTAAQTARISDSPRRAGSRLGERLRSLRLSAGLTQTELAGDRFSKEYVSQIERGKTRPTPETIEWLAAQARCRRRLPRAAASRPTRAAASRRSLARAEALSEAHRYDEAVEAFGPARATSPARARPSSRCVRSPARRGRGCSAGDAREALDLLARARELAEAPQFSDVDRAEILFRLGVCRYKLSSVSTAIGAASTRRSSSPSARAPVRPAPRRHPRLALALPPPPARLRGRARGRRARARARAGDGRPAHDREHLLPGLARRRADGPLGALAQLRGAGEGAVRRSSNDERTSAGCCTTSVGSTSCSGSPTQAIEHLKARSRVALEVGIAGGRRPGASASLATVHLHLGDFEAAEEHARHALELLEDREDYLARDRPRHSSYSGAPAGARTAGRGRAVVPRRRRELRADVVGQPPRQRRGSRSATSRRAAATTARRRVCTAWPRRRCRTSASRGERRRVREGAAHLPACSGVPARVVVCARGGLRSWTDGH